MKLRNLAIVFFVLILTVPAFATTSGQDVVELRFTTYAGGNETDVLRDLLDRFEAENPDIKIVVDQVSYDSGILDALPIQLAANEGPDMARVTDLGGLNEHYLDMTPYMSEEEIAYMEENFGPFLDWYRVGPDDNGIYSVHSQLTVTGPFINRTLFELAGVEVPGEGATWEEWGVAVKAVADQLGEGVFGMAIDRSGHRFAAAAISMGAQFFDESGYPQMDDEGMRAMAELLVQWHADGTMLPEIWVGSTGAYAGADEPFKNSELVFYLSGSWFVDLFSEQIGDDFHWQVVPAPCGSAGCNGYMPGGAGFAAFNDTEHPEEVTRVMMYLAQEDVLREYHARTLFIPAHKGLATSEIPWDTDLEYAKAALTAFSNSVPEIGPLGFRLQAYPYNRALFNSISDRLTQVLIGELTLDEAMVRMQDDVDKALAEAGVTRE